LFISALSLGEIQVGIEKTRVTDPAKAEDISSWADKVAATLTFNPFEFGGRG
jgi:hypothetical protein